MQQLEAWEFSFDNFILTHFFSSTSKPYFPNLKHLFILDSIKILPIQNFSFPSTLLSLSLTDFNLVSIGLDFLKNLVNLKYLKVYFKWYNISPNFYDPIRYLKSLKVLNFRYLDSLNEKKEANLIEQNPILPNLKATDWRTLKELKYLQVLNFSGNKNLDQSFLDEICSSLPNLFELNISQCTSLNDISVLSSLSRLKKLYTISLSNIKKNLFKSDSLQLWETGGSYFASSLLSMKDQLYFPSLKNLVIFSDHNFTQESFSLLMSLPVINFIQFYSKKKNVKNKNN